MQSYIQEAKYVKRTAQIVLHWNNFVIKIITFSYHFD